MVVYITQFISTEWVLEVDGSGYATFSPGHTVNRKIGIGN